MFYEYYYKIYYLQKCNFDSLSIVISIKFSMWTRLDPYFFDSVSLSSTNSGNFLVLLFL